MPSHRPINSIHRRIISATDAVKLNAVISYYASYSADEYLSGNSDNNTSLLFLLYAMCSMVPRNAAVDHALQKAVSAQSVGSVDTSGYFSGSK